MIPPQRVASAWRQSTHAARAAEVGERRGVLARGDLHPRGRAVAQQPQALEVERAHRLLEPAHAKLGEALGEERAPA